MCECGDRENDQTKSGNEQDRQFTHAFLQAQVMRRCVGHMLIRRRARIIAFAMPTGSNGEISPCLPVAYHGKTICGRHISKIALGVYVYLCGRY